MTTVNDALAEVGAYSPNPRSAWSAINHPGKPPVCVMFLWVNEVEEPNEAYASTDGTALYIDNTGTNKWKGLTKLNKSGSNGVFRHLQHALDECDGLFREIGRASGRGRE